jgi:hypothetical protein
MVNGTGNGAPDYSEAARETAYVGLADALGIAPSTAAVDRYVPDSWASCCW